MVHACKYSMRTLWILSTMHSLISCQDILIQQWSLYFQVEPCIIVGMSLETTTKLALWDGPNMLNSKKPVQRRDAKVYPSVCKRKEPNKQANQPTNQQVMNKLRNQQTNYHNLPKNLNSTETIRIQSQKQHNNTHSLNKFQQTNSEI